MTIEGTLYLKRKTFLEGNLCLDIFRSNSIYAVTAEAFSSGRSDEEIISAALAGGVRVIQLRDKEITPSQYPAFIQKIRRLKALTTQYQALLILNDYLDIALEEADGVHLGQTDIPLAEAFTKRRSLGREYNFWIGLSTHNLEEAKQAQEDCQTFQRDSDRDCSQALFYINVGPIYATQTKKHIGYPPLGVSGFQDIAKELAGDIPLTVMGGIKAPHVAALLKAGASQVAMITELTTAPDVELKVRELIKTTQ